MTDEIDILDPMARAEAVIPGGVNSPVRAFGAVGGTPPFIVSGSGARLTDSEGNEFIDYISSWGASLFGHADPEITEAVQQAASLGSSFGLPTEAEVEAAELVTALVPSVDKVRWVSSGTEATMSAIRLARAATGRDAFVKFSGCYHGHADPFLVAAGSGVATFGQPNSPGVPADVAKHTLTARFNDINSTAEALEYEPCAAVIIEVVAGNMGVVPAEPDFLADLVQLCTEHGTLLIFDEVMTGFRLAAGGAQEVYGIEPDLSTFGKIIGHGLPAAAFGGSAELMDLMAPVGPVYQAGTLSGNPLAIAAGISALERIQNNPDIYQSLVERTDRLVGCLSDTIEDHEYPVTIQQMGSMWTPFFCDYPVREFSDALGADLDAFARFHRYCRNEGVLLPPSAFEASFVTLAHDDRTLDESADVMCDALEKTFA